MINPHNELIYRVGVDHPEVIERINLFWGSEFLKPYLSSLMLGDSKLEYGYDVVVIINAMAALHDKEFPQFITEPKPFIVG